MGYRVLYLVQYGAQQVNVGIRSPFATTYEACAQTAGLQIIDDFDMLRKIADKGTDALKHEFMMEPNGDYGHMSPSGNRLVAQLVADALQNVRSANR